MRTVLIRPSNPSGSAYLTKWGFLPAPLGLLQLAGELLKLDSSSIRIIDMEAESMTVAAYEEKLRQLDSFIRKNGSFVAHNRLFFLKAIKE